MCVTHNDMIDIYQTNISTYLQEKQQLLQVSRYYSYARLLTFSFLALLVFYGDELTYNFIFYTLLLTLSAIFVSSIAIHQKYKDKITLVDQLIDINKTSLHHIARDWSCLLPVPKTINIKQNSVNADLNIIGEGSLGQLVFNQSTILGDQRLADWLDVPETDVSIIQQRQQAVRELTPLLKFRQILSAFARLSREQHSWFKELKRWASNNSTLSFQFIIAAKLSTALTIAAIVLIALKVLPIVFIAPIIFINIVLLFIQKDKVKYAFNGLERQAEGIKQLAKIVDHAASCEFESHFLINSVNEKLSRDQKAGQSLHELKRILYHTQLRFNPLVYVVLQSLFVWDIHILQRLNNWKNKYGDNVDDWLNAIADLEACCSLAALAHENPDWITPEFTEKPEITIYDAGHPLIPSDKNVRNDITIQPPTQLFIITGSNMSGKTTYMRTLGLNVKLASIGSNVCAKKMVLPLISVVTSMGVQDSLKDGRSYFMQELIQLKQVMHSVKNKPHPYVLVLLDEILKGTNASEKHSAVLAVMEDLLHHHALGAMTSHDINIAELLAESSTIQPLYFQEKVDLKGDDIDDYIHFDYIVKSGIVRNTNALKLMKIIGLDVGEHRFKDIKH